MNIRTRFLAVSAIALLGAAAVQAEEYQGVQAPASALGRSAVQAEAVAAAHAPNQNVSSASLVQAPPAAPRDRQQVRAEAVRAAYAPDQNISAGSRVNSQVVSTLPNPVDVRASAAGRASSRF